MSLTNTEQCLGARYGISSHGGSRDTHYGDRNGDCGNSRFAISTSTGKVKDNRIFRLSITKDGPWSIQLPNILKAIPYPCQDKYYNYVADIISTNAEPTEEYFLFDHSIKKRGPFKHHGKPEVADHFIGLDVPSGNSPTNSDMVEITSISNPYPHVPHHPDHNQGLFTRSRE